MHSKNQKLSLETTPDADALDVTLHASTTTCAKSFVIPLYQNWETLSETPKFDCDLEMSLLSANFAELVKQFDSFGTELVFNIDDDQVELSASGESGDMKTTLTIGNTEEEKVFGLISYDAVEECKQNARFAMRYMKMATKFEKVSEEVKLSLDENKPITLEYDLGDESRIIMLIAPRV